MAPMTMSPRPLPLRTYKPNRVTLKTNHLREQDSYQRRDSAFWLWCALYKKTSLLFIISSKGTSFRKIMSSLVFYEDW